MRADAHTKNPPQRYGFFFNPASLFLIFYKKNTFLRQKGAKEG
jgi:hypothetical protein